MYTINIVVEGIKRGLLMHKFSDSATTQLENTVKKSTRTQLTPQDEAEQVAYRLAKKEGEECGQLMLPAEHFLGAITKAGSSLQIKGKGKKTYKGVFSGNLEIQPDYIPLMDETDRPLYTYEIDSRPVKIQKARIIRHRPHLKKWRAQFVVEVADDAIPIEVIQKALEEAGTSCCVGDNRPRYGSFRVASCERA